MSLEPSRQDGRSLLQVAAGAALVAGAVLLARAALAVARDLAAHRADAARLRTGWTTVRAIAGAGGLRLHARAGGDGRSALPPLVLVHGYGVASSYFVPLAARLAAHAEVHVPDLPGHGRSDHDARPLTVPELAAALAAWMDARGLRGAVLVGHSLGSQIAVEAAVRRPELASALALLSPTCDPAARTVPRVLARAAASLPFERPSLGVWCALEYVRAGPRLLAGEMRAMLAHRVEDVLPRLRVPALVLRGAHDAVVPQRWAEHVAWLADAPCPIVVPRWAHGVQYEAPDATARAVLTLARAVARAASAGA